MAELKGAVVTELGKIALNDVVILILNRMLADAPMARIYPVWKEGKGSAQHYLDLVLADIGKEMKGEVRRSGNPVVSADTFDHPPKDVFTQALCKLKEWVEADVRAILLRSLALDESKRAAHQLWCGDSVDEFKGKGDRPPHDSKEQMEFEMRMMQQLCPIEYVSLVLPLHEKRHIPINKGIGTWRDEEVLSHAE